MVTFTIKQFKVISQPHQHAQHYLAQHVLSHRPSQLALPWKTGHVRFREHQPYHKSTLLIPSLQPHLPVCLILGSSTLMCSLIPQQSLTQALRSLLPRILQSQLLPQQIPEVRRPLGPSLQPNQQVLPSIPQLGRLLERPLSSKPHQQLIQLRQPIPVAPIAQQFLLQ